MGFIYTVDFFLGCLVIIPVLHRLLPSNDGKLSPPPGPKGWPFLGNVFDMPKASPWLTFSRWGGLYGDIMSVQVLRKRLVIINSMEAAHDLLEARGNIYSDRPRMVMAGELAGWGDSLVLCQYNATFRETRKIVHQCIGAEEGLKRFLAMQEDETRRYIMRVLHQPDSVHDHLAMRASAITLRIAYGYTVVGNADPMVNQIQVAISEFAIVTSPGRFLVDTFPMLKWVPQWFPGAKFKRQASRWRRNTEAAIAAPFDFVRNQLASSNKISPSLVSQHLESGLLSDGELECVKWAASAIYAGGADTTVSLMKSFHLAMTLYPDVQGRAQAEIDEHTGGTRLPCFQDREYLPFVNALVLELLRWSVVGPLAVAHCVRQTDLYRGYTIPKGSVIIVNIWNMLHDPSIYSDPSEFRPSRFLPCPGYEPESDPRQICFGFGRRTCPGAQLAETSVFIAVAMSLAAFKFSPAIINGVAVMPEVEYTPTTVSHPKPFPFVIEPRCRELLELPESSTDW